MPIWHPFCIITKSIYTITMKRVLSTLVLMLVIFTVDAQDNLYAEYVFNNNILANESKAKLLVGSEKSIFRTMLKHTSTKESKLDYSDSSITLKGTKIDTYNIYTKEKNEVVTYDIREDIIYRIVEESTKFKWKLKSDVKKIGKYNCQSAEVSFRGRNYIAWYTSEIPVSSGPYKFYGLPGLIV